MTHKKHNKFYLYATLTVAVLTFVIDYVYLSTPAALQIKKDSPTYNKAKLPSIPLPKELSLRSQISLPSPPTGELVQPQLSHELSNITLTEQQNTTARIAQLTELSSHTLQLRFPSNPVNAQQIIQYMHQCVGIDIGALQDNNLIRITHKVQQQSPMLRLSSGAQSNHEKALLLTYAKGLDLVRIYPYWFDQKMSQFIQSALGSEPLIQLSGEYKRKGQQLWLSKVTVNNKQQADWLLSNIQVCGA